VCGKGRNKTLKNARSRLEERQRPALAHNFQILLGSCQRSHSSSSTVGAKRWSVFPPGAWEMNTRCQTLFSFQKNKKKKTLVSEYSFLHLRQGKENKDINLHVEKPSGEDEEKEIAELFNFLFNFHLRFAWSFPHCEDSLSLDFLVKDQCLGLKPRDKR